MHLPSDAFATQDGIFRGIVTFKADLTHEKRLPASTFTRNLTVLSASLFQASTVRADRHNHSDREAFYVIFHFGHFGAVIQLARLDLISCSISAECPARLPLTSTPEACTDRLR